MAVHTVACANDWSTLSANGLDTVVDPMVVRCGEFFLKGAAAARFLRELITRHRE